MSDNISHIWIGQFGPTAPESYFIQKYDEDGNSVPCQFATDQGVRSFDLDFVEISWADEGMKDVRSFIEGHSYSDSYIEQIVMKASEFGVKEINVFVLADKSEFPKPRSVLRGDLKLWYCGEFDCEP